MERYRKKELLSMISTLGKANDAVILSRNQDSSGVMEVLAGCQDSAAVIGNFLETCGEPGKSIVSVLEEYCETLYRISLVLDDGEQCKRLYKIIRKQLTVVNNRIRHDLPDDKKEIVFLPYKASMWDSLESVWKTLSEDDNIETFVIPIPYYDKNPDGSFGQMYDESGQYPDYVPVTSWKEYDISSRKPDVIYIHNPYDECNYVTSVHPFFYARELKKYTDKLIYIPYFLCVNNQVKEEFCVLPGTIYADEVILQSQEVRDSYISFYHQWEDKQNCRDLFGKAEDKFVASGSPKIDKVMAAKREDFEIPPEWTRLIMREDGSGRKVVLYNTSIVKILEDSRKMLDKIKNVLQVFREQEGVVLLWRPHPLLRNTLQSMRKEYVQEYDDIVERYKKEGWGIFDDSEDLYRAIVVSDAYYGDGSSVVELYKHTGKPMMIQNMDVLSGYVLE